MQVEVVSADRVVWSGESHNVIAKTTDGEIGILPGHAPVLAVLQPSAVVIFCDDGKREVVAVDGDERLPPSTLRANWSPDFQRPVTSALPVRVLA